jgi:signal transduction histidine kinase/CheY-like chemotaxis protein
MPDTWTLLIVDDCAEDRKIYRRYLQKDPHLSYEFIEADSADTGLALWQQMQFDAILLDFCLPDMSGLEFLLRLNKKTIDTHAPVIMLTGRGDEAIAVQAMKHGVQDYLSKQNLKSDVLQLAVRNAIKQSCLQAQLSKTKERQRLIATTALRIRQSLDLEQILHTAVMEVQQILKCDRVVVYQLEPDTTGTVVTKFVDSCANGVDCGIEASQKYQINETCVCQIVGENYQLRCEDAVCNIYAVAKENSCSLVEFDIVADLVVPIHLNNNEKQWGVLAAHQCSEDRFWQPDEVEILSEVAVQLAIAIQQAELLSQTTASLQKEKQLNEFKSQFIATVSHEYRTPLASILAAASTVKQHSDKLPILKQQRFLEMIEQKARHMSKLVDDMLQVNQIELDKTRFKPVSLDLLQFFSELIEQQRLTIGDRHKLVFKITGKSQGFWGDRGLLWQIFTNLISNAIKYSPQGGNIEFHLIGKDNQVIFSVEDEGIGIPTADQKNLFKSFSRASNVDTIPGSGLGLVIVKACVELHGGEIALDSRLGQGTKVKVTLPKRPINCGEWGKGN